MQRMIAPTFALPFVFAVLIGLCMLVSGVVNAQPAALEGFTACDLPCWHAITPRSTSHRDAAALLQAEGYQPQDIRRGQYFQSFNPTQPNACRVGLNFTSSRVITVQLTECPNVRLGDLIALLGQPEGIMRSGAALTFMGGRVIVSTAIYNCEAWFSPRLPVQTIFLNMPGPPARRALSDYGVAAAEQAFAWRGFASRQLYMQAEADFPRCG